MTNRLDEVIIATSGSLTLKAICASHVNNADTVQFTLTGSEEGWYMTSNVPLAAGEEVTLASSGSATHSSFEPRVYWMTNVGGGGGWSPDGSLLALTSANVRYHIDGHECAVTGSVFFVEGTP